MLPASSPIPARNNGFSPLLVFLPLAVPRRDAVSPLNALKSDDPCIVFPSATSGKATPKIVDCRNGQSADCICGAVLLLARQSLWFERQLIKLFWSHSEGKG
ncbi:hypothetical protein BaRGS_00001259 [Batillaria attramentaria]|uniref:Uncharacterized protein n=1 Tax=Batillaria attramentaria TaxID=370345 RepID=A0ABD0M7H4_9CAEN